MDGVETTKRGKAGARSAPADTAAWAQLGRRVDHLEDTVGRLEHRIETGFAAASEKVDAALALLNEIKADAAARERTTRSALTPPQIAQTAAAIVVVVVAIAGFGSWWLATTVGKETEALGQTDARFAELIGDTARRAHTTEKRMIRVEERLNSLLEAAGRRPLQAADPAR